MFTFLVIFEIDIKSKTQILWIRFLFRKKKEKHNLLQFGICINQCWYLLNGYQTVKFLSEARSPGFLLSLYLLDDALHPGHQVSHHGEKAELLSCVHQLRPAAVAGVQQALPGFHHVSLCGLDAVRVAPCILGMKPWSRVLELLNLEEGESCKSPSIQKCVLLIVTLLDVWPSLCRIIPHKQTLDSPDWRSY